MKTLKRYLKASLNMFFFNRNLLIMKKIIYINFFFVTKQNNFITCHVKTVSNYRFF